MHALSRRLLAEFLGSASRRAVVGSGIAAQQLSDDTGLQLFENAAATAAGLFAIILMFGPVSGGHFNPVVSLVDAAFGGLARRDALAYIPVQVAGCMTRRDRRQRDVRPGRGQHLGQPSRQRRAPVRRGDRDLRAAAGDLLARAHGARRGAPPRSARTSAPRTSSPARRASPTRRSPSAARSRTPSRGSRRRRCRGSSPPRSSAGLLAFALVRVLYPHARS